MTYGENLPNSVADVSATPPEGWEQALRAISPITTHTSHLRFYWYRAGGRWVLYDCLPRPLIYDDVPVGVPMLGKELLSYLDGPPPRDRHEDDRSPFVSDVQHEFYRLYKVYARPFWVLQGEGGGHQVKFSPWQQNVLIAKGLPAEAPAVGSLPFAPFDGRTVTLLHHLNRLHKLDGSIERLQKSGSREAAEAEMHDIQKEIRLAEAQFIEDQMTPVVDMSTSLIRGANTRSEHADQVVQVAPGMAARAADAYEEYKQTGNWTLRDLTSR